MREHCGIVSPRAGQALKPSTLPSQIIQMCTSSQTWEIIAVMAVIVAVGAKFLLDLWAGDGREGIW